MSAIVLTDLKKSYGDQVVLKGLNLNITKGEVYGFIGMNGAGKTTTINLIMSLIRRDSGAINVLDEIVLFEDQQYKSKIGFVPDVPVFPSYMNAIDYLRYTLEMFGLQPDQQKIDDVLNFVSLQGVTKRINAFSRGMKQRLAIAQALIHDPDILIMDEPTSALDPKGRNDVMNIIQNLKGKKTIFYSTHILDDVEKVCDRIGILHKGELILEDTIDQLKSRFSSNKYYFAGDKDFAFILQHMNQELYESIKENHKGVYIKLNSQFTSKDLLKELVRLDVELSEFKQATKSIEEIFMEETA